MRITYSTVILCVATCVVGCSKRPTTVNLAVSAEASPKASLQVAGEPKKAEPAGTFAFAPDEGGKLLAATLSSDGASSAQPRAQSAPMAVKVPPAFEASDLHLPFELVNPAPPQIRTKEDPKKKLRPRMLPPGAPLAQQTYDIAPSREPFPVSPLVRIADVDVEAMQPVPTLSQPLPDRASLEDPTGAFSLNLVLSTTAPERGSPAPPWFLNLPDPFEHHQVVKIQALPPEDSLPPR
jgi:hypothetical protein